MLTYADVCWCEQKPEIPAGIIKSCIILARFLGESGQFKEADVLFDRAHVLARQVCCRMLTYADVFREADLLFTARAGAPGMLTYAHVF